jgi:tRNA(Glu) U13 pseudouridine synthase TruD
MFGPEMRRPPEGSPAAQREQTILAAAELTLDDFARFGKLAEGTRRPMRVTPAAIEIDSPEPSLLRLGFVLPPGTYATCVLQEVCKQNFSNMSNV